LKVIINFKQDVLLIQEKIISLDGERTQVHHF